MPALQDNHNHVDIASRERPSSNPSNFEIELHDAVAADGDDEVPMFEPDDDEEEQSSNNSSDDSADMPDTAERSECF